MAEYRRLLFDPSRFNVIENEREILTLREEEVHYLRRVLRLRTGQTIAIADGAGHLWHAKLQNGEFLKLLTSVHRPIQQSCKCLPQLGLGVVIPKRGMDDVMRMGCELGIDLFQPLQSSRSSLKAENRTSRWQTILNEAVEQSERLWQPKLLPVCQLGKWLSDHQPLGSCAFATTRRAELTDLESWLTANTNQTSQRIWVLIGPEGGWTLEEEKLAEQSGCKAVQLGDFILRTSTAAISVAQTMVSWRRKSSAR